MGTLLFRPSVLVTSCAVGSLSPPAGGARPYLPRVAEPTQGHQAGQLSQENGGIALAYVSPWADIGAAMARAPRLPGDRQLPLQAPCSGSFLR